MAESIVELQTQLDTLKHLSDLRLAEQRKVDELKKQEYSLRDGIIGYLYEHPEVNGIVGSTHKGLLKEGELPIITDYDLFKNHILETDQWDLALLLKPSTEAVRLRKEEGEEVPGVGWITQTKLSITKL